MIELPHGLELAAQIAISVTKHHGTCKTVYCLAAAKQCIIKDIGALIINLIHNEGLQFHSCFISVVYTHLITKVYS